jgi:hypothetical protein
MGNPKFTLSVWNKEYNSKINFFSQNSARNGGIGNAEFLEPLGSGAI